MASTSATEYIYWARKIGAAEWQEELLAERPAPMSKEELARMSTWMEQNGYDIATLRVSTFTPGELPNFGRNLLNV